VENVGGTATFYLLSISFKMENIEKLEMMMEQIFVVFLSF
jgi:hypothetical protein